jgi:hypothetical protein
VEVVTVFGTEAALAGQSWSEGDLLYCGPGGVITNDYQSVVNSCNWVMVLGRALGPGTFLYEPSLPMNTMILHD